MGLLKNPREKNPLWVFMGYVWKKGHLVIRVSFFNAVILLSKTLLKYNGKELCGP